MKSISVVLPSYNEAENLPEVIDELRSVLESEGLSFEIVVVDDGSTDDTTKVMTTVGALDPRVRSVRLRRNFGKSVALAAGFTETTGSVVILMDADGQDDPHEIPKLLAALDGGLHLVTGRRATREDRFVKRSTSVIFNGVTSRVTGVPGKDFNSGLKAMKRPVVEQLNMYGEMHRYIPVLAHWAGFRVGEVPVNHRPRKHGTTKFGGARFLRGFLDLLTVQFLTRFTARPLHLFGSLGIVLGAVGGALLTWMGVLKVLGHGVGNRPALLAGIFLIVVAVQIFTVGLLAEFLAHSRGRLDVSAMIDRDPPD